VLGTLSSASLWLVIGFWLLVSAAAVCVGKARVIQALATSPAAVDWLGVAGGVPLVWANLIPLTLLLYTFGGRGRMKPLNTEQLRWFVVGWAVSNACLWLPLEAHSPHRTIALGVALGFFLEIARRSRSGLSRWNLLEIGRRLAAQPAASPALLRRGLEDPKHWPFFALGSKVFISYSRTSEWGSSYAHLLYRHIRAGGGSAIFDRESIPAGAGWQQQLDRHIGEADGFVVLCDAHSIRRPWVAAELAAALEGRRRSGFPELFLLKDPSLSPSDIARGLPVFRLALDSPPGNPDDTLRVITLRDGDSARNLGSTLVPGKLTRRSVFPEGFRLLLLALATPVMAVSSLLPIFGVPALLVGIGAQMQRVDLDSWFRAATQWWLGIASGYAIGIAVRQAVGARYDAIGGRRGRVVFSMQRLSAIGFATLGFHFWKRMDPLSVFTVALAVWAGWTVAAIYVAVIKHGQRAAAHRTAP
jgi:hypothetical protein